MKNLVLSLVAVLLTSNFLFGQYDVSKINKKAIEAYNKGLEKAQDGKYKEAIESLTEAINRDPKYIDAYLSLAGVYGQTKDHKQSVATYEKAFTLLISCLISHFRDVAELYDYRNGNRC